MNIYQHQFNTVQGDHVDFSTLTDKVILVVNTASHCGWTWHYEQLEHLHQKYKDQGLVVIAFPSNDFGNQEPGTDQEIADFCSTTYKVTFPVVEKSSVINTDQNPLFAELISITGNQPGWNFNKYLIGKNAGTVKFFDQIVNPTDELFLKEIEHLL